MLGGQGDSGLELKNGGEMVFVLPAEGVDIHELVGMLKKLGVTECFSSAADFSGIGTVEGEGNSLYIDSVIQNTQIAIDEKGVTASAYTQVVFDGGAIPDGRAEMLLDRPFLYAVVDSNGVVIFIGICDNPV